MNADCVYGHRHDFYFNAYWIFTSRTNYNTQSDIDLRFALADPPFRPHVLVQWLPAYQPCILNMGNCLDAKLVSKIHYIQF